MPTYKYIPNLDETNQYAYCTDIYNEETDSIEYSSRILYKETFKTNKYLSKNQIKRDNLEFISDEPYISPIIVSYSGSSAKHSLEVPDYNKAFDIYVSLATNNYLKLYFNNNKDKSILVYHSGPIFHGITNYKIRTINTELYVIDGATKLPYTIALMDTNQIGNNNG